MQENNQKKCQKYEENPIFQQNTFEISQIMLSLNKSFATLPKIIKNTVRKKNNRENLLTDPTKLTIKNNTTYHKRDISHIFDTNQKNKNPNINFKETFFEIGDLIENFEQKTLDFFIGIDNVDKKKFEEFEINVPNFNGEENRDLIIKIANNMKKEHSSFFSKEPASRTQVTLLKEWLKKTLKNILYDFS